MRKTTPKWKMISQEEQKFNDRRHLKITKWNDKAKRNRRFSLLNYFRLVFFFLRFWPWSEFGKINRKREKKKKYYCFLLKFLAICRIWYIFSISKNSMILTLINLCLFLRIVSFNFQMWNYRAQNMFSYWSH